MTQDVKKRLIILGVVVLVALLFLFPTLKVVGKKLGGQEVTAKEILQGGWISKPISLGLDLSGGVHLVYEVQAGEAVKSRMQSSASVIRSELRAEKIVTKKAKVNDKNEIELVFLSERSAEKAKKIIEDERRDLVFKRENTSDNGVALVYGISDDEVENIKKSAIGQAVETLRSRVDQFGVTEPTIQRIGEKRIMLQMPGVDDIEAVKEVVGKVAKLEFRLLPTAASRGGTVELKNREGETVAVEDLVQMTGDIVDNATVDFDPTGQIEVALRLTSEGGKVFGKVTGANVGRNLAIILDGMVYSSPTIRERIGGGRCSITGGFSMPEAQQLALILRAGALPAPLEIMTERTVGPTLGAESIRKGVLAIFIGFVAVIFFMGFYYKKSGLVASAILFLNVFLVLAALSAFGATLTLPGLAGLALTVGMAVDANVIIFERVREEIRNGAGRDAAVASGFEKALSAIIDSNVTTLLAGLILYYFGTGPIRGFAVTLSIGIVTTIFCATFVARLFFDWLPLKGAKELSI